MGRFHSFAHGRTTYDLKLDYRAVAAELQQADDPALETLFVKLALTADLNQAEIEKLRNLAHQRTKLGKRALDGMLKTPRAEQAKREQSETRERRRAERQGPAAAICGTGDGCRMVASGRRGD